MVRHSETLKKSDSPPERPDGLAKSKKSKRKHSSAPKDDLFSSGVANKTENRSKSKKERAKTITEKPASLVNDHKPLPNKFQELKKINKMKQLHNIYQGESELSDFSHNSSKDFEKKNIR